MTHEPAGKKATTAKGLAPTGSARKVPGMARCTRFSHGRVKPHEGAVSVSGGCKGLRPFSDLDRNPASRAAYLGSILAMAVDPRVVGDAMRAAGIERPAIMAGAAEIAGRAGFRVQEVAGTPYILCPVPALYDGKRGIESGFAVDVDQDYFAVHAYMNAQVAKQALLLPKLARWVCGPIAVEAPDYAGVGDGIKAVANEVSAALFVNSLVARVAAAEANPRGTSFDDLRYDQLLGRLAGVTDPRWISHAAIGRRFEQVMGQFEKLDAGDPMYKNDELRTFVNMARCIFGAPDADGSRRLSRYLEPGAIKPHEATIRSHVEKADFVRFLFDQGSLDSPLRGLLEVFSRGGLRVSRNFATCILDILQARAADEGDVAGMEDFVGIGRHPDYVAVYGRAARMAGSMLGPGHVATKLLDANLEACKLGLDRQASDAIKGHDARFQAELEAVARSGSERIPFDQVEATRVSAVALGVVLDGIDSMGQRPEAARGIADAPTWFRLGRVLDRLKARPDAAFCYRAAIVHQPHHAIAWYNLHIFHEEAGDPHDARRCVEIALKENPFNPGAWGALGSFEEDAGRLAEAEVCFRTAVSLKRDIEADPALVETRISESFWEGVVDGLRRFLERHRG
ncbi:MAG: tetratricopeptide repeat protein [Candidatus Lokiarchaeota archaeon]|nr:tetratricopeptide repeat protein [Candidatus Lokiarchaeota archaeon]